MLLKKTVDGIIGGLAKMERQLQELAVANGNEVVLIAEKVTILETDAAMARDERDRAMRVADKIRNITA